MRVFGMRIGVSLVALLAFTGEAWADLAPDPMDPTGPYALVAVVAIIAIAAAYLIYRRRK